ncbi:MAG TPA: HAMP domain-containing sensor histidine kinase [Labilithrix sp.]|nr:HAMP domain-containing sensor histidine kinase [Labilithrix sp.]
MNQHAARLVARLIALQLAVHAVTFLLTAAFAPRVLLLEPASSSASLTVVFVIGVLTAAFSTALTFVVTRRLRPALRSLAVGSAAVDATDVLSLYAVPARLAVASAAFPLVLALATLVPQLRPQALDTYTDLTLVLLMLTIASTAALPAYVTMRASVARVLELAPPIAAHEALRRLGRGALGRVRRRFVAAVAAPVAFVALGASLLVDAHARTYDRDARVADATDVARAVFEPIESHGTNAGPRSLTDADVRGRAEAIEAAALLGYRIQLDPDYGGPLTVRHGDEGETQVTVPTLPGAALVRFGTSRLSPVTGIYVLLAFVAIALAAILGTRIGAAFESDVALATREVRRAGVAEVMRGTIISHEARFANVHALLKAVDSLGGVFREFAGAQQRSIDAREATERMRGLLLASMSHDLKAPLNAVLGFAELVGRNPLTDPQKESLAIIEQRGRELLMLIDTILDSARVEAGELEVSPEQTHVGDVVMSSVLEARDLAVGTDVQILGEIQPGMPTLFVDATRIVQALTAIVMTAARFSDKGVVQVRATLPDVGSRLRVEVETSGEGLPVGEREKIFDAFKSAESARRHGGLGLGLQLARSIVEIHGGTIEVDNTARGGMIFRVWLPVENDRASIRLRASKPTVPS